MTEYRNNSIVPTVPQDTTSPATGAGAGQVHLHSMLATCCYDPEMMRVQTPPESAVQAVSQEFNAYVLSKLSPKGTHPLAFWEVRSIICIYQ